MHWSVLFALTVEGDDFSSSHQHNIDESMVTHVVFFLSKNFKRTDTVDWVIKFDETTVVARALRQSLMRGFLSASFWPVRCNVVRTSWAFVTAGLKLSPRSEKRSLFLTYFMLEKKLILMSHGRLVSFSKQWSIQRFPKPQKGSSQRATNHSYVDAKFRWIWYYAQRPLHSNRRELHLSTVALS